MVVPLSRAGHQRVTHPSATFHFRRIQSFSFDLHALGTPLAFILSQDQTLHKRVLFPYDLRNYCFQSKPCFRSVSVTFQLLKMRLNPYTQPTSETKKPVLHKLPTLAPLMDGKLFAVRVFGFLDGPATADDILSLPDKNSIVSRFLFVSRGVFEIKKRPFRPNPKTTYFL